MKAVRIIITLEGPADEDGMTPCIRKVVSPKELEFYSFDLLKDLVMKLDYELEDAMDRRKDK